MERAGRRCLRTGNGDVDRSTLFHARSDDGPQSTRALVHSRLQVEGGDDLVGFLFRVMKSQAADREIDDFMTVPRSRPG